MIRVERLPGSAPTDQNGDPVLEKKDPRGRTERDRAIAFFQRPATASAAGSAGDTRKTFRFKAYGQKEVRDALDDLFHKKCAYCETYYGASQPVDVEHYRPKGAVDDDCKRRKPGYYWLASDWDNLLPSCIDCNRKRGHKAGDETDRVQLGKANQFPIAGVRATEPVADLGKLDRQERPLLLHPCRDDPGKDLSFTNDGIIRGLTKKGETSIEVFGLNRAGLVRARKERALQLLDELEETEWAIEDYNQKRSQKYKQRLRKKLRKIKDCRRPSKPYASMCRQIVARRMPWLADVEDDPPSGSAAADASQIGVGEKQPGRPMP